MKILIALDPGASGGMAFQNADGTFGARPMPETVRGLKETLTWIMTTNGLSPAAAAIPAWIEAYVELVSGNVGKMQPGSRMFTFGENFGVIQGMLEGMGIKYTLVRPQTWIETLGLGTKEKERGDYSGLSIAERLIQEKRIKQLNSTHKKDWKNKLKARAQKDYPGLKVTLATADALNILTYARQQF